jgi:hypothetical protein
MKTFKQILSEMDKRFGTPEDPRLNINNPKYHYTGRYDPEYVKTMGSASQDSAETNATSDTEKSRPIRRIKNTGPTLMTFQQIANHLGMDSHQSVERTHNRAIEKLRTYFNNINNTH